MTETTRRNFLQSLLGLGGLVSGYGALGETAESEEAIIDRYQLEFGRRKIGVDFGSYGEFERASKVIFDHHLPFDFLENLQLILPNFVRAYLKSAHGFELRVFDAPDLGALPPDEASRIRAFSRNYISPDILKKYGPKK